MVEFRPYDAERYKLDGPDVGLAPAEALALGLLFHELATNAAKYGALSDAAGCVSVSWSLAESDAGPCLALEWVEQGGPPVTPPSRRGFGSRLIERSLKGELKGEAHLDFAPDGLRCRVELPLRGEEA
jgi:two-component sensor histidine kinase